MERLTRFSHIGHSPETNFAQLTDLVKRRRTFFCLNCVTVTHEQISVLQLSPNGATASKFTNLVVRLLDQVSLPYFAILRNNRASLSLFLPGSERQYSFSSHFLL